MAEGGTKVAKRIERGGRLLGAVQVVFNQRVRITHLEAHEIAQQAADALAERVVREGRVDA